MRTRKKKHGEDRLFALSDLLYAERQNFYVAAAESDENGAIEFDMPIPEPEKIFSDRLPLRLELGCGKGDFICGISERETGYNYVAVERMTDVIISAMEKYAVLKGFGNRNGGGAFIPSVDTENGLYLIGRERAGNVRFLNIDVKFIEKYFMPESVETVYLNFSDPWMKKGYAKRRLTYREFLECYHRLLAADGMLKIKTDNRLLYEFTLEQLADAPFETTFITEDLHSSQMAADNVMTEYERNFSSQGKPIYAVFAAKQ